MTKTGLPLAQLGWYNKFEHAVETSCCRKCGEASQAVQI